MWGKGKFTNLDVNDDGSICLEFVYHKRFGKISDNCFKEIADYLRSYCKGLTEVTVIKDDRPNELMICMKFEKVNDEPLGFLLDKQEEALTSLCNYY